MRRAEPSLKVARRRVVPLEEMTLERPLRPRPEGSVVERLAGVRLVRRVAPR